MSITVLSLQLQSSMLSGVKELNINKNDLQGRFVQIFSGSVASRKFHKRSHILLFRFLLLQELTYRMDWECEPQQYPSLKKVWRLIR